jgi:hypothetical protein
VKQQHGSNTESKPCLYSQYHAAVYNSTYAIKVGNIDGYCTTHDSEPKHNVEDKNMTIM